MEQVKCFIPETLEEALRIRKETGATVLAGGSDLMVANSMGAGVTPAFKGDVLIITNLKELKGIRALPDGSVEIGACTTSAEIARSPKGDMPQPLILMDAEVVLTSVDGERRMLVDDYIIATKKTALREDEIITKVIIPKQDFTHIFFRKIGMRRANAISKLTLSAAATVRDGVVVDFRASSGAAGPKVARSRKAEELLIGKKVSELHTCKEEFLDAWNTVISPHAMPEYRRNTTRRMLAFFIDALEAGHAPGRVDIQE